MTSGRSNDEHGPSKAAKDHENGRGVDVGVGASIELEILGQSVGDPDATGNEKKSNYLDRTDASKAVEAESSQDSSRFALYSPKGKH